MKGVLSLLWPGLILLIGFSRVYFGIHYPIDVMAGLAIGGAILILSIALSNGPGSGINGDKCSEIENPHWQVCYSPTKTVK